MLKAAATQSRGLKVCGFRPISVCEVRARGQDRLL